ncbi:MAG: hypothetical protein K2X34_08485 [Hyphomonadaceae bacterium]|nr:hypothetical protein [Hyphomonadaceae bacterium]
MRTTMIAAMLLVAACGQTAQTGGDAPAERILPQGTIIASGENWTYEASQDSQGISFVVDDGAEPVEAAEAWAPPQTTETGYRLQSGELTLDLVEAPCTRDDIPHPMRATVTYGESRYEGCAAIRWDHQLIALMPQIDACMARSPQTRWVTYAGRQAEGNILVRLSGGDAFDCTVTSGNAPEVISFGPRGETLAVATDGAALFVRGPGDNPGGACYDAPEVRGADGALLGWMMDPMGC